MPKKIMKQKENIEKAIMAKVLSNQVSMKPRLYFLLGSFLLFLGVVSSSIVAVFLISITFFLLRQHGPNGPWRLQQMLLSFPLWIPLLALIGIGCGVWALKQYDFSYKKNFFVISIGFISAIIFSAVVIEQAGWNDIWLRVGPMRRLYQGSRQEGMNQYMQGQGNGQGRGLNWQRQ